MRAPATALTLIALLALGPGRASPQPPAQSPVGGPPTSSAEFDRMYQAWMNTPAGSREEMLAGEELRAWVEARVGREALDAYQEYLEAPVGTPEEADALRRGVETAMRHGGLREERALQLLETYFGTRFAEQRAAGLEPDTDRAYAEALGNLNEAHEGGTSVGDVESVELSLVSLQVTPGSPVTMEGVLRNNGTQVIYFAEGDAALEVRPPLSHLVSPDAGETQFIPGLVAPSIRRLERDSASWVAVHPGQRIHMLFEIPSSGGLMDRWFTALFGPPPGEYGMNAVVPYVFGLPRPGQDRQRALATGSVQVDATLSGMLPLAWIGGLIVLLFQSMRLSPEEPGVRAAAKHALLGILPMVALVAIVLVLSTALEGIELLPHLSINSRGAAIASGMLIQFLGFQYIRDRIPGLGGSGTGDAPDAGPEPAPAPAPGD